MNKATITKIVKRVNAAKNGYSVGFNRLTSLPKNARMAFNLSMITSGVAVIDAHAKQKAILESLSESEFEAWLATIA